MVLTNPGDTSLKWLPEKDYGEYVDAIDNVSITIEQGKAIGVPARSFMIISKVD
jgi:hypothetical protein